MPWRCFSAGAFVFDNSIGPRLAIPRGIIGSRRWMGCDCEGRHGSFLRGVVFRYLKQRVWILPKHWICAPESGAWRCNLPFAKEVKQLGMHLTESQFAS